MGSSALIFAACGVHIKAVSFNYPLLFHLHSIIIVTYFKEIVKMYIIDGCKLTKLQPEEGEKKKGNSAALSFIMHAKCIACINCTKFVCHIIFQD